MCGLVVGGNDGMHVLKGFCCCAICNTVTVTIMKLHSVFIIAWPSSSDTSDEMCLCISWCCNITRCLCIQRCKNRFVHPVFFNHVNSCAREAESDVVNPRVEGNRNHAGMPTGQRRQAGPGAPPGNQGVGGHGRPRQLRLVYSNIAALRFGISNDLDVLFYFLILGKSQV